MTGPTVDNWCRNGRALGAVAERSLFTEIVKMWENIDRDVGLDIDQDVSYHAGFHLMGTINRLPGGVFSTGGLSGEGVWVI